MSLMLAPAPCTTVADVAAALAHARAEGVELAVDLRPLRGVFINPLRRVAWVQPGATWAELDAAAQEHGLAVTGARDPRATVAASALGAGSGWLERRFGLTCDNLRAVRVLSADGVVFTASHRENPDLFWALRGGGSTFAVPVELELALRPLGPDVLGGMLRWPRERAREVAAAYRTLIADAPDAVCGGLVLRGGEVGVLFLYAGAPERGKEHLAALRALAPAADDVRVVPYCELQRALPAGEPDGHLGALPDAALDPLLAEGADVLLQPLGGAYGRVDELATATGPRAAAWAYQGRSRALEPWVADGAADERAERLRTVKRRWDPDGVLG